MNPFISIIIPCKEIDSYAKECVNHCKQLDYPSYEILLLPDGESTEIEAVNVISTGPISPGAKRNIGIANSKGALCAFLDSDAYPREDWLKNSVKYFDDADVVAIGGPGITPEDDTLLQKASGFVLSSFVMGRLSNRYKSKEFKESDDIHSCNFIVRKEIFENVKWNEKYWPGEDTLMCLGIIRLGNKMLEVPDVVVYHHRRPLFIPHLIQVSRFGIHRGFFVRTFPENSIKLVHFLPSILLISFLLGGLLSSTFLVIKQFFILGSITYFGLTFYAAMLKSVTSGLIVWLGLILTHFIYGVYFLIGLSKQELKR